MEKPITSETWAIPFICGYPNCQVIEGSWNTIHGMLVWQWLQNNGFVQAKPAIEVLYHSCPIKDPDQRFQEAMAHLTTLHEIYELDPPVWAECKELIAMQAAGQQSSKADSQSAMQHQSSSSQETKDQPTTSSEGYPQADPKAGPK
ncbi:unnamed protein product, partial [Durusdinium trenchii]